MFLFNDKAPKKIKFNNKSVNTLVYNGIVVWTAKVLKAISGILPLTIGDCADNQSIANYKMYGNSVQNGIPTPANPIEIESVGEYDEASGKYKIPVVARHKNLFDINTYPLTKGKYVYWSSGNISTTTTTACTEGYVPCRDLQGKDITINHTTGYNVGVAFYNDSKTYISGVAYRDATSKTVTVPDNAIYFRFSVDLNYINEIQVELGTSATEYEPYNATTITTNIYLDKPLMGIGKAFDYIDFENQKVVRKIGNCLLGVSARRDIGHDTFISYYYLVPDKSTVCDTTITEILSPSLLGIPRNKNINLYNTPAISSNTNNTAVFYYLYKDDVGGDTDALVKAYLQANPITIYYELATPIEESVDLPQLPNFEGTTVLDVNTIAKPNMDISYYTQGG